MEKTTWSLCILVGRRWSKWNKIIKWTCKINMFSCFPSIFAWRIGPHKRTSCQQRWRFFFSDDGLSKARFWRCRLESRNSRQRRRWWPLCSSKSWICKPSWLVGWVGWLGWLGWLGWMGWLVVEPTSTQLKKMRTVKMGSSSPSI